MTPTTPKRTTFPMTTTHDGLYGINLICTQKKDTLPFTAFSVFIIFYNIHGTMMKKGITLVSVSAKLTVTFNIGKLNKDAPYCVTRTFALKVVLHSIKSIRKVYISHLLG